MNAIARHILIADDHAIIRIGLRFILNSQFSNIYIDEVGDKINLLQFLEAKPYSNLILDLQFHDDNALGIIPVLRKRFPDLFILVYSMSDEAMLGKRLLKMGANGFLSKLSSGLEVKKALNLFLNGRNYISDQLRLQLQTKPAKQEEKQNPFDYLSLQEMAVVTYLMQGIRGSEIASKLQLKSTTVSTYKARIFDKLKVKNLLELQNFGRFYELNFPLSQSPL